MAFGETDPQTNEDGDSSYEAYSDFVDGNDQNPQDRDYDTVKESDDRSDVDFTNGEDWNFDDAGSALSTAQKVLDIAKPALSVLAGVVKSAGGDPKAVAALKALEATTGVAGGITKYLSKQRSDDLSTVPVNVPTTGAKRRSVNDEVLAALARVDE